MSPSPDRPLNDAERDRLDAMLSRFRNDYAMNNAEEVDGFFAALICSPEIAKPSQYWTEIWGGEMADDEAFDDQQQFQDFRNLLIRHWNSIGHMLERGDIFTPLLFEDEAGIADANNWARSLCVASPCTMKAGKNCSMMRTWTKPQPRAPSRAS
jgi:uncharacterized protein